MIFGTMAFEIPLRFVQHLKISGITAWLGVIDNLHHGMKHMVDGGW